MRGQGTLQPAEVEARHIRSSARVSGGGWDGPVIPVLGFPLQGSTQGLNGKRGWQEAQEDGRLQEEGGLTITLPNAVGEDGVAHLQRFACLTDPSYQVGDEWIEISKKVGPGATKPLFVGSPADWNITPAGIQLTLADAWWIQNLQRDTAAAFILMSPRDLWEQYSRGIQAIQADDFNGQSFIWSTSPQTSADGYWSYTRVAQLDGSALLDTRGASANPLIFSTKTIPIGKNSSDPNSWWKIQARVNIIRMGAPSASAVYLSLVNPSNGDAPIYMALLSSGQLNVYTDKMSGPVPALNNTNQYFNQGSGSTDSWGRWDFVIEGRGRFVFFYVNGRMVEVLPASEYTTAPDLCPAVAVSTATEPDMRVALEEMTARRSRPYLLRGADKGDYAIPGSPASRGLQASYFEVINDSVKYGLRWPHLMGRPAISTPPRQRVETAVNKWTQYAFDGVATTNRWVPDGTSPLQFGARWTGSIYLDLDNHDYRLSLTNDDYARVWIARTGIGQEYITDFPAGDYVGKTPTISRGVWLKGGNNPARGVGPTGIAGFFYGQPSGWYPIIVEYVGSGGSNYLGLDVARDDYPALRMIPGEGSMPFVVMSDAPSLYWKMGEGTESLSTLDMTTNFFDGAFASLTDGSVRQGVPGPNDGTLATRFAAVANGETYTVAGALPTMTGDWSYEVTIKVEVPLDATYVNYWPLTIGSAGVANQALFFKIGASNELRIGNWGTEVGTGQNLTVGRWYHVTVTYVDSSNTTTVYLNGVQVLSTTGVPTYSGSATAYTVGLGRNHFRTTTATDFFRGAMCHFALYPGKVLTQLAAARRANVIIGGNSEGIEPLLSPIGIVDQQGARFDSYYAGLKNIIDTYGYQATFSPRQLESGEFPGQLIPRIREGRDTAYVLDEDEAINVGVKGSARDIVSGLIGDAQGLSDSTGASGVTVERFNFEQINAHALFLQGMQSLPDMTDAQHVIQRLDNVLALSSSPWEELTSQPSGKDHLVGSYALPTPGGEQPFDWAPGDGVLVNQPRVGIVDTLPRQIMGRSRQLVPDGIGEYQAQFRQRPRSQKELVRQMLRQFAVANRTYQGQLVVTSGSMGQSGFSSGSDAYSRCPRMPSWKTIQKVYLVVVTYTGGTTDHTIVVQGVNTGEVVTGLGHYDVTMYATNGTYTNQVIATLSGGNRTYEMFLLIEAAI